MATLEWSQRPPNRSLAKGCRPIARWTVKIHKAWKYRNTLKYRFHKNKAGTFDSAAVAFLCWEYIHAAFLHALATYGPVRVLNAAKDLLHVREEQLGSG